MTDAITEPIDSPKSDIAVGSFAPSAVEEFKRTLGDEEPSLVTMTANRPLMVHTTHTDIAVLSAMSGYQGTGADITSEALRHIGVPDRLISRALRYAEKHPDDHYVSFWVPREPISSSFFEKLLGKRSRSWQCALRRL